MECVCRKLNSGEDWGGGGGPVGSVRRAGFNTAGSEWTVGRFRQLGKPQLALYELSPIGGENIRRLVDACQHSIREQR